MSVCWPDNTGKRSKHQQQLLAKLWTRKRVMLGERKGTAEWRVFVETPEWNSFWVNCREWELFVKMLMAEKCSIAALWQVSSFCKWFGKIWKSLIVLKLTYHSYATPLTFCWIVAEARRLKNNNSNKSRWFNAFSCFCVLFRITCSVTPDSSNLSHVSLKTQPTHQRPRHFTATAYLCLNK